MISWSTWEQIRAGLDIFQVRRRPSLWQKATAGSSINNLELKILTETSRSDRLLSWLVLFDPEKAAKLVIKCCLRGCKAGNDSTEKPFLKSPMTSLWSLWKKFRPWCRSNLSFVKCEVWNNLHIFLCFSWNEIGLIVVLSRKKLNLQPRQTRPYGQETLYFLHLS